MTSALVGVGHGSKSVRSPRGTDTGLETGPVALPAPEGISTPFASKACLPPSAGICGNAKTARAARKQQGGMRAAAGCPLQECCLSDLPK